MDSIQSRSGVIKPLINNLRHTLSESTKRQKSIPKQYLRLLIKGLIALLKLLILFTVLLIINSSKGFSQ